MARPVGSPIQRDSRWPMEEKTIIPFQCHYASTMKLFASSNRPFIGREEELGAIKRLDQQARQLEDWAKAPSFDAFLAEERHKSPGYGGRSVFGWERDAVGLRHGSGDLKALKG